MTNQFKRGNTFDFSGEVNVTDDGVAVPELTVDPVAYYILAKA